MDTEDARRPFGIGWASQRIGLLLAVDGGALSLGCLLFQVRLSFLLLVGLHERAIQLDLFKEADPPDQLALHLVCILKAHQVVLEVLELVDVAALDEVRQVALHPPHNVVG